MNMPSVFLKAPRYRALPEDIARIEGGRIRSRQGQLKVLRRIARANDSKHCMIWHVAEEYQLDADAMIEIVRAAP